MKAIVQKAYGSPDVFALEEVATPTIRKASDVLVRVHTAALHAGDCFIMRGEPYVARLFAGWPKPRGHVPGFDVAGWVEATGGNVTRFHPGDQVFGQGEGTCAEHVRAAETALAPKPANLTLEQAAAVPMSALTALHGLRDAGKVRPGHKVLINGASGGVGTFAVQIAKTLGAEVTGVCSTRNVDMVRSIGADHVIDYTREDFTRGQERYDLILDNVANRSFAECRRVLAPRGTLIPNSGNGGLGHVVRVLASSAFVRQRVRLFLSIAKSEDLLFLKGLIEAGRVTPVIDRTYPLAETAQAFRYLNEGHARGKVVIAVDRAPSGAGRQRGGDLTSPDGASVAP
jgi:NADPH:quinone reductase-like Zn-dependent oxidoreductase